MFSSIEGNMKTCNKCGIEKELTEFGRQRIKSDGFDCYCFNCRNKYRNQWYTKNRIKAKQHQIDWRKKNPEKYKAHIAVKQALIDGKLVRMPCEKCGNIKVQGHHDSYLEIRWLDVRWLCEKCHIEYHKSISKS